MMNAIDQPQTVLVLGGRSDIAQAIVRALASPTLRTVVLGCRSAEPIEIDGGTRTFIEDGDTLTLSGAAEGDGYRIGFGDCVGQVVAALDESELPYSVKR